MADSRDESAEIGAVGAPERRQNPDFGRETAVPEAAVVDFVKDEKFRRR
jgi:hypothetical protein